MEDDGTGKRKTGTAAVSYASNESKSMQLHETPVIAAISVRNM